MGRVVGIDQNSVENSKLGVGRDVGEPADLDTRTERFFTYSIVAHSNRRFAEVGSRRHRGEDGQNNKRELHFAD